MLSLRGFGKRNTYFDLNPQPWRSDWGMKGGILKQQCLRRPLVLGLTTINHEFSPRGGCFIILKRY
jgi:hypothetical protein